jgi:hypothetical protein
MVTHQGPAFRQGAASGSWRTRAAQHPLVTGGHKPRGVAHLDPDVLVVPVLDYANVRDLLPGDERARSARQLVDAFRPDPQQIPRLEQPVNESRREHTEQEQEDPARDLGAGGSLVQPEPTWERGCTDTRDLQRRLASRAADHEDVVRSWRHNLS